MNIRGVQDNDPLVYKSTFKWASLDTCGDYNERTESTTDDRSNRLHNNYPDKKYLKQFWGANETLPSPRQKKNSAIPIGKVRTKLQSRNKFLRDP